MENAYCCGGNTRRYFLLRLKLLLKYLCCTGRVEVRELNLERRHNSWLSYREQKQGIKSVMSTEFLLAQSLTDTLLWRFTVEDQLFVMGAIDITGDGLLPFLHLIFICFPLS